MTTTATPAQAALNTISWRAGLDNFGDSLAMPDEIAVAFTPPLVDQIASMLSAMQSTGLEGLSMSIALEDAICLFDDGAAWDTDEDWEGRFKPAKVELTLSGDMLTVTVTESHSSNEVFAMTTIESIPDLARALAAAIPEQARLAAKRMMAFYS